MARPKTAAARGLIRGEATQEAEEEPAHARYLVDAPLDQSVEHWWAVRWALGPGTRRVQETLPHPAVHVTVEDGRALVVGVVRGRFTRALTGSGRVFGAKFRPGAFRPLLGAPVATLTDRVVPFARVVGARAAERYAEQIEARASDDDRVAAASAFFRDLLPPPPSEARLLGELVEAARSDRALRSVEALRARSGMHLRELQRWFRDAVGISPKWMIQRYRLHEALLSLEERRGSVAEIAAELGYADQAHFARDFRALVGVSPSRYAQCASREAR